MMRVQKLTAEDTEKSPRTRRKVIHRGGAESAEGDNFEETFTTYTGQ